MITSNQSVHITLVLLNVPSLFFWNTNFPSRKSSGSSELSKQTNNIDNSDRHEYFLDGKLVFQKNKDGTFNKTKVICTLCGKTFSFHRSKCVGRRGEFKWNTRNHPHLTT